MISSMVMMVKVSTLTTLVSTREVMETEMKRCDKSDKRENERETLSLGHFVSSWDGDAGTMSTSSHMTHTN